MTGRKMSKIVHLGGSNMINFACPVFMAKTSYGPSLFLKKWATDSGTFWSQSLWQIAFWAPQMSKILSGTTILKNKTGFLECGWPCAPTRFETRTSRPVVMIVAMSHTFVAAGVPNLPEKSWATRCDCHCCGHPLCIKGATTQRRKIFFESCWLMSNAWFARNRWFVEVV